MRGGAVSVFTAVLLNIGLGVLEWTVWFLVGPVLNSEMHGRVSAVISAVWIEFEALPGRPAGVGFRVSSGDSWVWTQEGSKFEFQVCEERVSTYLALVE